MFRSSDQRHGGEADVSLERLSGRVHVLAERVDTLGQTVATTAAAIAKKDGELAIIRRELEASRAQVHAALADARPAGTEDLRELQERVAALAAERVRSSDESRASRLEAKVALLAERVDTLSTTVASTAAGLAGREGDVVALRRRVEQVAGGSGVGPVLDDVLRRRIDDLGAATASASMRMESLSEQISSLRDTGEALARRLERAEQERAALASSVADAAASRWRDLERALARLADRLAALEAGRTAQDAVLAKAASLWPAALRSLEARVTELAQNGRPHAPAGTDPSQPPLSEVGRFLAEVRALERRLDESDAHARHEREELGARVRRLESDRPPLVEDAVPVGADVLRFPSSDT